MGERSPPSPGQLRGIEIPHARICATVPSSAACWRRQALPPLARRPVASRRRLHDDAPAEAFSWSFSSLLPPAPEQLKPGAWAAASAPLPSLRSCRLQRPHPYRTWARVVAATAPRRGARGWYQDSTLQSSGEDSRHDAGQPHVQAPPPSSQAGSRGASRATSVSCGTVSSSVQSGPNAVHGFFNNETEEICDHYSVPRARVSKLHTTPQQPPDCGPSDGRRQSLRLLDRTHPVPYRESSVGVRFYGSFSI